METLRENISNTINELNKLLMKTTNSEEENKLRKLRRIYFDLFEDVIKKELDNKTSEFKDAIDALKIAKNEAVEAKKDIEKIANAINKAVSAAKAIDKVVKIGIDLMA